MKVSQEIHNRFYAIVSYQPDGVTIQPPVVAGHAPRLRLEQSFILTAERLETPPELTEFAALQSAWLLQLAERYEPEMVLIGSGSQQRFLHPSQLQPLYQRGIGVEVMNSHAACRTYNALIADERRVVAVVLLEPRP